MSTLPYGIQPATYRLPDATRLGRVRLQVTSLARSLVITGTFDGVMRTVGTIEYGPDAVSVAKLTVTALEKGSWQANMDILVGSRIDAPPAKP